jgi:site-specific DNA-methyltransferase (adenine-specific)
VNNKLFFRDNLQVMKDEIDSQSVDLVYLDPPFNSQRDYNIFLIHQRINVLITLK